MNKIKKTLTGLAASLAALTGCENKTEYVYVNQPVETPVPEEAGASCEQQLETRLFDSNGDNSWAMISRADSSLAMKYTGVEPFGSSDYLVKFVDKFGTSRTLVAQLQPNGEYEGEAWFNGYGHKVWLNLNGGFVLVDQNGDGKFEALDKLENKVSRCEFVFVPVGQDAVLGDSVSGVELVKYQGHTQTEASFLRSNNTGFGVLLYTRADGALGGDLVLDGQTYKFALSQNGRIIMDRNGDGNLERFVSEGLPSKPCATGRSTPESWSESVQASPSSPVYSVTPTQINKFGDNGRGTVIFSVNGEVTKELSAPNKYVLADGTMIQLHSIDLGNSLNPVSYANYSLHSD